MKALRLPGLALSFAAACVLAGCAGDQEKPAGPPEKDAPPGRVTITVRVDPPSTVTIDFPLPLGGDSSETQPPIVIDIGRLF